MGFVRSVKGLNCKGTGDRRQKCRCQTGVQYALTYLSGVIGTACATNGEYWRPDVVN